MCRLLTKPLPAGQVAGGTYNVSITSSGVPRWYLISIPQFYEEEQLSPVILSYHSSLENATSQMNLTQMSNPYFNNISFVIYSQGINVCISMKRHDLTDILRLMARNSKRQLQRHQIHKRYTRPDRGNLLDRSPSHLGDRKIRRSGILQYPCLRPSHVVENRSLRTRLRSLLHKHHNL
jgi:hypothetical protein